MARTARSPEATPRPLRRTHPRPTPPRTVPRAVRARGESVLDALLQGRAWIALVALLLAGIVFFNVDLLRLNRSIAVNSERAEAVSQESARLRRELARLHSSERVQRAALQRGLALPAPGDVRFRRARARDGARAVDNLRASRRPAPRGLTPPPATPPAATLPTRAPLSAPPPTPPPTPQVAAPPTAAPQATVPGSASTPATTPGAG